MRKLYGAILSILIVAGFPILCFTVGYDYGRNSPCQEVEKVELKKIPNNK